MHDAPKIPYQRLRASTRIAAYTKRELQQIGDNTNPVHLRRKIEEKIRKIFAVVK
jgi:hypothetical protein